MKSTSLTTNDVQIIDLPDDALHEVLNHCDGKTQSNLALSCRLFKRIKDDFDRSLIGAYQTRFDQGAIKTFSITLTDRFRHIIELLRHVFEPSLYGELLKFENLNPQVQESIEDKDTPWEREEKIKKSINEELQSIFSPPFDQVKQLLEKLVNKTIEKNPHPREIILHPERRYQLDCPLFLECAKAYEQGFKEAIRRTYYKLAYSPNETQLTKYFQSCDSKLAHWRQNMPVALEGNFGEFLLKAAKTTISREYQQLITHAITNCHTGVLLHFIKEIPPEYDLLLPADEFFQIMAYAMLKKARPLWQACFAHLQGLIERQAEFSADRPYDVNDYDREDFNQMLKVYNRFWHPFQQMFYPNLDDGVYKEEVEYDELSSPNPMQACNYYSSQHLVNIDQRYQQYFYMSHQSMGARLVAREISIKMALIAANEGRLTDMAEYFTILSQLIRAIGVYKGAETALSVLGTELLKSTILSILLGKLEISTLDVILPFLSSLPINEGVDIADATFSYTGLLQELGESNVAVNERLLQRIIAKLPRLSAHQHCSCCSTASKQPEPGSDVEDDDLPTYASGQQYRLF
ncbi:MAG: hypothetical protein K0S08_26 [Gammaproteobacteria bacterium]|jgi:hypothetical protein|nr:hypothetical protein [Gammaproteobacteria bacterium]